MPDPIYAIGDIHGHLDKLDEALTKIERDGGADAAVVFLGDLVDRGPDSPGVIDRIVGGVRAGRRWIVLKGNHDRFMTRFLADPGRLEQRPKNTIGWLDPRIGGRDTLRAYGVDADMTRDIKEIHADAVAAVPKAHLDFLENLPLLHHAPDLLFVHAGIRPGVPLDRQTEDDLLWIRQDFHKDPRDHGPLIVHGHTPVAAATHYGNRVNLDSGAGHGHDLTAAVLLGRDVFVLTHGGRLRL